MSAKNIRAIFNSALDPRLKPLAVLLALYGHADGTSIFPSVETLGGDLGLSSRQIQRLIGELLDTGTLVNETPRTGGRASGDRRGRTTRYRLDLDALPQRSEEHKPRHQRHPFVAAKGDTHVSVSDSPRVTPASPKGDMGDAKGDMGVATMVTPVSPDLPIDLPTRSSSTFTAPDGAVSDELDESLDRHKRQNDTANETNGGRTMDYEEVNRIINAYKWPSETHEEARVRLDIPLTKTKPPEKPKDTQNAIKDF